MQHNIFRPSTFEEFIGQSNIISNLKVFIESAKKRHQSLDHIMIHGNSGLGKTSLGFLISKVLNKKIYVLNGPSLQKPSDIISPLTSIKENEIIFIDEIHAVSKEVFEILYPVLEDNKLNIIIGKEYNSKVVNIKIPSFTLIGATTEINKLSFPFVNRFPINFHFKHYNETEIARIIKLNCQRLNLELNDEVIAFISKYCQNNPRVSVNILKRVYDYIIYENAKTTSIEYIKSIFKKLEIYDYGLTSQEVTYLKIFKDSQHLGIESIQQIMGLQQQIIIHNIEPILIRNLLIVKTAKGRCITEKGSLFLASISNKND